MKKTLLAVLICATSATTMAQEAPKEDINYGDPTASFSTVGVSGTDRAGQVNMMYGAGSNIFQLDLGYDAKVNKVEDRFNYRGRYFHVTDGLGYSVDVLGGVNNTTVLGGLIYKMPVSEKVTVFPMLSAGYSATKDGKNNSGMAKDSGLAQAGVYAMYAFDDGHWLYANPKTTYHVEGKQFVNQIEVGGGLMTSDVTSVGFKLEHTTDIKANNNNKLGADQKADTVAWLQANYYF